MDHELVALEIHCTSLKCPSVLAENFYMHIFLVRIVYLCQVIIVSCCRVCVRGISALGESHESDTIEFTLGGSTDTEGGKAPPGDNKDDDKDGDSGGHGPGPGGYLRDQLRSIREQSGSVSLLHLAPVLTPL